MENRFLVREETPRAFAGAEEILGRLRALAEIEVAGEQIDDVVAGAVHLLRDVRDAEVERSPTPAQQSRVGRVLHERVVEDDYGLRVFLRPVE